MDSQKNPESGSKPRTPKKQRSHVKPVELLENVSGGRGAHTAVSVLEPVMSIERTDNKERPEYRIVAYFKLQVKIHAFEKGYRKKNEKLFDSISLRYLYHGCEKHEVKPHADGIAKVKENEETTTSKSLDVGAEGNPLAGGATPTIGVHVARDNKLAYERDSKSWRRGLSFESYSPCATGESGWKGSAPVGEEDWCYDRCAHWFWQTEAAPHLWTPETYESYTTPITVTRIIPTKQVDATFKAGGFWNDSSWHWLHFDFVVTTRLRELGWKKFKNPFSHHSSKPAEVRVKEDFGYPIKRDRMTFCLWSCPSQIYWPEYPTMIRQEVADKEVAKYGPVVQKVLDSKCYFERKKVEKAERRTKEKEERAKEIKANARLARLEKHEAERHPGRDHHYRHHHYRHEYSSSESRSRSLHPEILITNKPTETWITMQMTPNSKEDEEDPGFEMKGVEFISSTCQITITGVQQDGNAASWSEGGYILADRHLRHHSPRARTPRSGSRNSRKGEKLTEVERIQQTEMQKLEREIREKKRKNYLRYLYKRRSELATSESESSTLTDGKETRAFKSNEGDNDDAEDMICHREITQEHKVIIFPPRGRRQATGDIRREHALIITITTTKGFRGEAEASCVSVYCIVEGATRQIVLRAMHQAGYMDLI
ncbi:hypothetical protein DL95DRAFT_470707 [Leptodontidium sp. 2 PMI_412]|nr:hypothetical protein DL95DRAFT_470707 [Leptodontidium sp. 2 PMI_412]